MNKKQYATKVDALGPIYYDSHYSLHYKCGTMVFWNGETKPYWVLQWQAKNGAGCYWIIDAEGNSATAAPDDLTRLPNK